MGTQDVDLSDIAYEDISGISKEDVRKIVSKVFPEFKGDILDTSYAASIGQVNLGRLDEKDVAIKILILTIQLLIKVRRDIAHINAHVRPQNSKRFKDDRHVASNGSGRRDDGFHL